MEIAGLSLAANILQTVQFSLNVLSVLRKIHKGTDAFPGYDSLRLTTDDLITRVKRMQASAALGSSSIDSSTLTLYDLCLSTSHELMELLNKLKVNPNGKMRAAMRQSLLVFSSKEHINELENRINGIRQEILFSEISRLREGMINHSKRLDSIQNDVTRILEMLEERPKAMGYPGHTVDNQLKIDDGLGQEYFLPVELCSKPESFFQVLTMRYKSQNLPGLKQITHGHFIIHEWNERHEITYGSWAHVLKRNRAVKITFVVGTWTGYPRDRCMRCFKPGKWNTPMSSFRFCKSCLLAVRWVEPDYFPFEPLDTVIYGPDTYRDYRVRSRQPRIQHPPAIETDHTDPLGPSQGQHSKDDPPSIDLVCRRMIMKWEPILNVVYRYMGCLCVLWRSTPSRHIEEMTFVLKYGCPRHSTGQITYKDYNELGLYGHDDPYFQKFGGYNAFWAMLHRIKPKFYDMFGGATAISEKQLKYGYIDLEMQEKDGVSLDCMFHEYLTEILSVYREDPSLCTTTRPIRRATSAIGGEKDDENAERRDQLKRICDDSEESVQGKEIKQIVGGTWDGVPHWSLIR